MKRFFPLILIALVLLSACRKDNVVSTNPNHKLFFSVDTVMFDTVFTSLGSSTHQLKIYNAYKEDLNISEVRLMGGEQSRFKINFDGESGTEFHDKIVPAGDSIFSFLSVTIDPSEGALPFIVEDSLMFVTNGNQQTVKLVAWGQNAHYIVADRKVNGFPKFKIVADSLETTHWYDDLPYVIYGYALINSYGTLHIHEGARIYIHGGGGIWSYIDGQLIVDGTAERPVTIQGDRLEPFFKNQPGQWDRIWLMEARQGADHYINHAVIRNAFIGIQAESSVLSGLPGSHVTQAALLINNTVIENHTGMGVYSVLYAIGADNLVVDNCGQYALAFTFGGDYLFRHSTIGNSWWQSPRTTSSVYLSNYVDQDGERYEFPFHLEMKNSIVYGAQQEELSIALSGAEVDTTYLFDHCLMKTTKFNNDFPGFAGCIFNLDPMFVDYRTFNLHLGDAASSAVGSGSPVIANEVPYDLEGNDRRGTPDLGAYQLVR